MKGFGTEGCTGGKKVIGNDLGKIPNPQAPKIVWNESPKESTQVQQVGTALGDQLEPPKIWGWDEGKTTPHFCSFTIILSALCCKCISLLVTEQPHTREGERRKICTDWDSVTNWFHGHSSQWILTGWCHHSVIFLSWDEVISSGFSFQ